MDISDQTKNYKRIPHSEEKRKQDHKPELSGLNDSNGHTHVPRPSLAAGYGTHLTSPLTLSTPSSERRSMSDIPRFWVYVTRPSVVGRSRLMLIPQILAGTSERNHLSKNLDFTPPTGTHCWLATNLTNTMRHHFPPTVKPRHSIGWDHLKLWACFVGFKLKHSV